MAAKKIEDFNSPHGLHCHVSADVFDEMNRRLDKDRFRMAIHTAGVM